MAKLPSRKNGMQKVATITNQKKKKLFYIFLDIDGVLNNESYFMNVIIDTKVKRNNEHELFSI